ncbi:MAG TPA: polymer-forming cytoskeletal protein [Bacteroidetes bacterium]|nr:polymer-forming cytoskeletal protein [Bacteroidota bacterium]
MLGTKTKPKVAPANQPNGANGVAISGETCVISAGTVIEGKMQSSENIRLDGTLKGELTCDKRLVMGEKGKVEGNITTCDAVVMGTIEGELTASGTLTLKGTAYIKGTITAKSLVVEEGARYFGDCHIG